MWRYEWVSVDARCINGRNVFRNKGWKVYPTNRGEVGSLFFSPAIALHTVKVACERPDEVGQSLSQWFCADLAGHLMREGLVPFISASTVRRILEHHKLKPWRHHLWLSPKEERDPAFYATVAALAELYTRDLSSAEIVLCVDEKTSLQPRPRLTPTRPPLPGNYPNRVEHHYRRDGALNLFAAFDTRTGKLYGQCFARKRQIEFIAFLETLDLEISREVKTIHIVCDNVSTHHGKEVQRWLRKHPRFRFHFTPTHCSWINQVEQWFSILQRKRFRFADFDSKADLQHKIEQFIAQWNQQAHPFNWSSKSVAKVMAKQPDAWARAA